MKAGEEKDLTTITAPAKKPESKPAHSVRILAGLYQLLRSLIPDAERFFGSMIEIEETGTRVRVTPRHTGQTVIEFTRTPNPLAMTEGAAESGSPPPEKMRLTMPAEEETEAPPIRTTLEREFEQATLEMTKQLLRDEAQAGRLPREDAEFWEDPANEKNLKAAAKCIFYTTTDTGTTGDLVDELHQKTLEAMGEILEADVLDLLRTACPRTGTPETEIAPAHELPVHGGGLTIRHYNKAAMLLGCTEEFRRVNGGAVPWILAQPETGGEPTHQGQFIGAERAAALAQGLTPKGWSAMTRATPTTTLTVIHQCGNLSEAAAVINWLADLNRSVDTEPLGQILARPEMRAALAGTGNTTLDRNIRKATALTIGAQTKGSAGPGRGREGQQQLADALTYALATAAEGNHITATTFGGLIKAVKRWHDRLNRERIRQQWQNMVNDHGGVPRTWEPVLETFEHGGVTATELTSEEALLAEALELDHCVHLYGTRSARGNIRVFSLKDQDGTRATTAIMLTDGKWQVEQTRTRKNHQASEPMRECGKALAESCNGHDGKPTG